MPFCVYHHKMGTEVVYVGVGGPKRPYQKEFRTQRWHDNIDEQQLEISVVKWFKDRKEAELFEKEEIKRFLPKGNYQHTKEKTAIVIVPAEAYQKLRKEAFRRHKPMTEVIAEIINDYFKRASLTQ